MIAIGSAYDNFERVSELAVMDLLRDHIAQSLSRELKGMIEWAEENVILPRDGGPFEGLPFSRDRQPYLYLLAEEIRNGLWSEIFAAGPNQSGKTFGVFVLPTIYAIAELKTNVVVGVPDLAMINDKWMVDLRPVFEASPRLAHLLPATGAGSKGGKVTDLVEFTNGVHLRFMTKGGSDTSKAGFTARRVHVTEAAGWSRGTATSKEADPLRQLRARQRATSRFDEEGNISTERQLMVEGTVTVAEDLPWREKEGSSDSQIVYPCCHCKEFMRPEREHFIGWQGAANELDAARRGFFSCPKCGQAFTEAERSRMVRETGRIIHKGQSIDKDGVVHGERPQTSTLFFRWSAWDNLFVRQYDLAAEEWKASQLDEGTDDREMAEKALCQQVWCIPYKPELVENAPLQRAEVRKRIHQWPAGVIPRDAIWVTTHVDVGKWVCWYYVLATLPSGEVPTVIYGSLGTGLDPQNAKSKTHEANGIKNCLRSIFDMMDRGFAVESGGVRPVDLTLCDAGYMDDAVYAVIRERPRARFMASLGRGKTQMDARRYEQPRSRTAIVRLIGERYHLEFVQGKGVFRLVFDADHAKLSIQACLRVAEGHPGALTLPMAPDRDHKTVSRHLASEVYRRWIEPGKGLQEEWTKKGQNHYLDAAAGALVAQKHKGWRLPESVRFGELAELIGESTESVTENKPAWQLRLEQLKAEKSPIIAQVAPTIPAWKRRLEELKANG